MNPNTPRDPWSRLVAAARTVPDTRDEAAPYGFATRLAALAFAGPARTGSVFDRLALRALGVACLLAVASVAINYSSLGHSNHVPKAVDEEVQFAPVEDPVSALLDA